MPEVAKLSASTVLAALTLLVIAPTGQMSSCSSYGTSYNASVYSGIITSPNYPLAYCVSKVCRYTVAEKRGWYTHLHWYS